MNLAKILSDAARRHSDKPAIIFENSGHTFNELDNQVGHYSAMLAGLGVKVGDRVAIQLPKRMEFIFLELAVMSLGGIALPLNPDYKADEIHYFLTDSGSSLFFTDRERFSRSGAVLQELRNVKTVLIDSAEEREGFSLSHELERTDPHFTRQYPASGDDVAMIIYTSGTTGRSKGAMLTHRNLISNMQALHETWEWSEEDVLLHVLPLFHVHGLFVALHGGLNAGATIIMHEKFDPSRTWEYIDREKCTLLMGVPTMYQRLANQWELMEQKPDLRSMRLFVSGSAPLLETLFNRFERETGFRILERYGMTEAGMITSNPTDLSGRKARSVGYPLPGVQVRVVSPAGIDAAPSEVGEVWIRGDNLFTGYWGMPEKTAESFQEGWFKTGDLGYQDSEDGNRLYLVGRAKELIITGGYNVYPKEIEDILESHGTVREAAVVGRPDDDLGEQVIAVVSLKEAGGVSAEELVKFCKERLAGYKCPKQVFVMDSLPRNAMGKLQKNLLVEQLAT
jgi:malonyl-CoA/methylmalonyl-CoA synthetase